MTKLLENTKLLLQGMIIFGLCSSSTAVELNSNISEITIADVPVGSDWCQTVSIQHFSESFAGWIQFDVYRPGKGVSDEAISVKTTFPYKVSYRAAFNLTEGIIKDVQTDNGMLTAATILLNRPETDDQCLFRFEGPPDGALWGVELKHYGKTDSLIAAHAKPPQPKPVVANVAEQDELADALTQALSEPPVTVIPLDPIKLAFSEFSLSDRKLIQQGLANERFYSSSIDGLYGPGTNLAIGKYLESVGVTPEKTSLVQSELSALKNKVVAEKQKREQELEKPRLAEEEARQRSRQINEQFLLEDITAFAKETPTEFNALELAILYTPAKKEFESGAAGSRFDQLLEFVSQSDQFIAFARERETARRTAERMKLDGLYVKLEAERDRVKQLVAEDPFSESSMKMTLTLLDYQDVSRKSAEQDIDAAILGLQAVAGIEIEVVEGKAVAGNGQRVSDGGRDERSDKEPSKTPVKGPIATTAKDGQKIDELTISATDDCSKNPSLCSLEQLCERATSYATGKLDWDVNDGAAKYIDFAKRFGMSCGIAKPAQVSSVDTTIELKKKPMIEKYKNRKALVIGNANYTNQEPLKNPINDARAVSAKLEEVGFEVIYKENLGVREFGRALSDFERSLTGSDMSLFYYAGHGIEIDKQNYLIPVDASIRSAGDVRYETVRLDDAVDVALNTSKLSMVLIDACRDNPFSGQMRDRTRSVGRGLSVVEVNSGPVYQIVSFAASSGQVAEDGDGQNSPYATVLVDLLDEPNLEVGKMFRLLGDRVSQLTNGAQQPTKRDNLRGEDIFLVQH